MSGYIGPVPVPQGIQNKETFTATAGQTTFNTNGYTDGAFINVYLNGVRLINGTDYTATNGQSPAYEWNLSDPNPPIGAWASLRIHQIQKKNEGKSDIYNLSSAFRKLLLDYGWWANRTDSKKESMFDGGFLGLDNIAIFDRSKSSKYGEIFRLVTSI